MRYMVVIEKGSSSYGAFIPDLPGCLTAVNRTCKKIHPGGWIKY